jgi:hypothetical protein
VIELCYENVQTILSDRISEYTTILLRHVTSSYEFDKYKEDSSNIRSIVITNINIERCVVLIIKDLLYFF